MPSRYQRCMSTLSRASSFPKRNKTEVIRLRDSSSLDLDHMVRSLNNVISPGTGAASFTQTECGPGPMPRSSGVLLPEHLICSWISGSFLQPGSNMEARHFSSWSTALSAASLLFLVSPTSCAGSREQSRIDVVPAGGIAGTQL